MKILHLVQKPQLRGAEVFTTQLAAHINRSGHEAVIAFVFPGEGGLTTDAPVFHLGGNPSRRMWDLGAWRRLARIIRAENPQVIQANAGDTLKYAVCSKLLFGWKQPIIFRNASTISLYIKSPLAIRWNSFFFRHADKIISVSRNSARDFSRLFPQYQDRVTTIPVGIETTVTNGDRTDSPLAPFQARGPVLVHVGGFSFEKNHAGLIRIFERLLQRQPGATLHLVGSGPLKAQTESLVRQMGLDEQVFFHGFRKDAMDFIRGAHVLLLPSIIEGLPGVILESFFCRTPVVAYEVGGIPEIVQHGKTGWLVPPGNEEAFAGAVLEAMETPEGDVQVQNAYHLVTAQYLNSRIADAFLGAYEDLLDKNLSVTPDKTPTLN